MSVITDKIRDGFEVARRLNEAMWLDGHDSAYLSVDEYRDYVVREFGVPITLRTVDVEVKAVYGFIERYDNGQKACVYIVKNIPPRWKRLVAVKEICHVVLDGEADWNPDGLDTLQRLMNDFLDLDAIENAALRSEHIAEIVAYELLYPHECRKVDIQNDARIADIASKYRLPESVVQALLTPPYMAMCDKYWGIVDALQRENVAALRAAQGA